MEAAAAIVSAYATDKLTSIAEGFIKTHVIERWTRKRAIEFYKAFSRELLAGDIDGRYLRDKIDELLSDEARSEIVFEAYRLVCLTRSKTIGPRIIAVVVAEIVQRDAIATDDEEMILAAAESLSDDELLSVKEEMAQLSAAQKSAAGSTGLAVVLEKRHIDSNSPDQTAEIGPGSLIYQIGMWAEKLCSLGLVSHSVMERSLRYCEDSERHIDMDGTVREFEWSICYEASCVRLADLVAKVTDNAP